MRRSFAGILACGIGACSHHDIAREMPSPNTDLSHRIDAVAATALQEGPVAGVSIAVVKDNEILHVGGYGVTDLEAHAPVSPETLFDMASITKILTAAAVLTLVDTGRLDLDEDLASLLPGFPNTDQGRKITLRHMLNHTSGLSDYVDAEIERWKRTREPLQPAFVFDYLRDRPLDFEPGTNWRYSNSGFYLAGLIIERVTGKSWNEYTLEAVARPLGLQSIALCDDLGPRRPSGFDVTGTGLVPSREADEEGVGSDGGLCGTALDVARLPGALTSSGLLSQNSLSEMLRPTVLASGLTVDYGLGVALGSLQGHSLWGHLGGNGQSYTATLAHYPDRGLSIAVLVNTLFGDVGALQIEASVAGLVLGLGEPTLADHPLTSPEQEAFVGTYAGDRGAHSFTIAAHAERIVRPDPQDPGSALALLWQRGDIFGREDWPLDRFVFHRRRARVVAVSIYYNGFFDGFYLRTGP